MEARATFFSPQHANVGETLLMPLLLMMVKHDAKGPQFSDETVGTENPLHSSISSFFLTPLPSR
jgi:hypothetical protein